MSSFVPIQPARRVLGDLTTNTPLALNKLKARPLGIDSQVVEERHHHSSAPMAPAARVLPTHAGQKRKLEDVPDVQDSVGARPEKRKLEGRAVVSEAKEHAVEASPQALHDTSRIKVESLQRPFEVIASPGKQTVDHNDKALPSSPLMSRDSSASLQVLSSQTLTTKEEVEVHEQSASPQIISSQHTVHSLEKSTPEARIGSPFVIPSSVKKGQLGYSSPLDYDASQGTVTVYSRKPSQVEVGTSTSASPTETPVSSELSTPEDIRLKTEHLRLRLQLALYRVQTNQLSTPISKLQVHPPPLPLPQPPQPRQFQPHSRPSSAHPSRKPPTLLPAPSFLTSEREQKRPATETREHKHTVSVEVAEDVNTYELPNSQSAPPSAQVYSHDLFRRRSVIDEAIADGLLEMRRGSR